MRPGGRFGRILHGKSSIFFMLHALDCIVVEVQVGHLGPRRNQVIAIDGVVVVLNRNFYPARGKVFHRMVTPMMAELKFAGPATQGPAKKPTCKRGLTLLRTHQPIGEATTR